MSDIIQILVFAGAAILHGITGMAFPMIGTTSLSFVMPLPQAVAMMILPSLILNVMVLFAGKTGTWWAELRDYGQRYWRMIVMSAIGSVVGVKLLLWLPAAYIYAMMAVVTLYYAVHGYANLHNWVKPLPIPTHHAAMMTFGFVAGVVGGASNAMSPIVLMFLFAYTQDKHEIAKASNICYLVGKLVQLALLQQQMTAFAPEMWRLLFGVTLVSLVGVYLGAKWRQHFSQKFFKTLIYLILLILSLKMGYSAIVLLLP